MTLRAVYEEPSAILHMKMPEIKIFGPAVYPILKDLRDTMVQTGAVGLAANQIGVEAKICVILIGSDRVIEFINPDIIQRKGKIFSVEACLSIPDYLAIVPRSTDIKIGYKTRDNKVASMTLSSAYAIRAQHEIDHLNGILIKDYVDGTNGKSGGVTAKKGTIE